MESFQSHGGSPIYGLFQTPIEMDDKWWQLRPSWLDENLMKSANSIVPRSPSAFIVSLRTPAREDFRRQDPGFSGQEKGQGKNQPCLVGGLELFYIIYGMSSFPLTNSIIFQDGHCTTRCFYHIFRIITMGMIIIHQPPTRYDEIHELHIFRKSKAPGFCEGGRPRIWGELRGPSGLFQTRGRRGTAEFLRGNPGKCMGKYGKCMRTCGKCMGKYGKCMRKCGKCIGKYEKFMRKYGKCMRKYGKCMRKIWEMYEKIWEMYEKISEMYGKLWEMYGKMWEMYGKIWEMYEKIWEMYEKIWEMYGKFCDIYEKIWEMYEKI